MYVFEEWGAAYDELRAAKQSGDKERIALAEKVYAEAVRTLRAWLKE